MNLLEYLMMHCTLTPIGRVVTKEDLHQWHIVDNKWKQYGYTDFFHLDGKIENLIPFNQNNIVDAWEISNGAYGFNGKTRHFAYVGGLNQLGKKVDTLNQLQISNIVTYMRYMIMRHPKIKILGHNQANKTACPGFYVPDFCRAVGIPEINILDSPRAA